ncbi:MAG: hypothetical protein Q9225_002839 [Loekoesia sp. 1 TL-2023]
MRFVACSSDHPSAMMLLAFLTFSVLIGPLYALSIPSPPAIIVPPHLSITTVGPNSNLTSYKEWPPTPFFRPFDHNQLALNFVSYGREPRSPIGQQVTQALDVIIYKLLRSPKKEFHFHDPAIAINGGIVSFHMQFLATVSNLRLAMIVQVVREMMYKEFGPREILMAEFGQRQPWVPMARFSVRFLGVAVD